MFSASVAFKGSTSKTEGQCFDPCQRVPERANEAQITALAAI